jgi:hypothetical protein
MASCTVMDSKIWMGIFGSWRSWSQARLSLREVKRDGPLIVIDSDVLHELLPFSSLIASIWCRFEFGPNVAEFTNSTQVRCASEPLRVAFDLRRV